MVTTMKKVFGRVAPEGCCYEPRLMLAEDGRDVSGIRRRQRQDAVVAAGRIVRSCRDVRRVHVVLGERPAYDEIAEFRQVAEAQDLEMSVDGSGTVSMRPRSTAPAPDALGQVRRRGGAQS